MSNFNLGYLVSRLDDLQRSLHGRPKSFIENDIDGLTKEVLGYVAISMDLSDLNTRLEALATLDIASLREAVQILEGTNITEPLNLFPQRSIKLSQVLAEINEYIDKLEATHTKKSDDEIAWALEFHLAAHFKDALLCAVDAHADLSSLVELVSKKVSLLTDEQISTVWHYLQEEFDSGRRNRMQDPDSLLPNTFLQFESPDKARTKLSEYVVIMKPTLTLSMIRHGASLTPKEVVELPRILTWQSTEAARPVTKQEELLARSISRLCAMYERTIASDKSDLSSILGLSKESRIISGSEFKSAKKELEQTPLSNRAILYELRTLARILDTIVKFDTPIEHALRQYKLGLEVMAPEILQEMRMKGELVLQKELCRFLLERSIFSVGTKFGRSETDLFAEHTGGEYTIEAKVFRRKGSLSRSSLNHAVVQLQNYLDQRPSTPRGILVIYNLTDDLLTASRAWIQGRYWILPINLQPLSPSLRKRSFTIEPGQGDRLIDVVVTEESPRHKSTKTLRTRKPSKKHTR